MPDKGAALLDDPTKQGVRLLKLELDLSFTFVTLALTAYADGSLDHARQAANDAQRGYRAAQKLLAKVELSQTERRAATARLEDLERVLAKIEARDPGVFSGQSSAEMVRE
jgi:hypothetical protein